MRHERVWCLWCCVRQILNLFLALLLSSFTSENLKKGQQQDQDGVDKNDDDDDNNAEDEDESKSKDNQIVAAFERLQRWVKFLAVRLGSLRRRKSVLMNGAGREHGNGRLIVTSTTDTACNLTTTRSPHSLSTSIQSPQPALLADCNDTQVARNCYILCDTDIRSFSVHPLFAGLVCL